MTYPTTKRTRAARRLANLCRECGLPVVPGLILCETHRNSHRENSKRAHRKLKDAALNAYGGPRCVCCGESLVEFLTIDHVNNDGAAHRREIFTQSGRPGGGSNFYNWLRRNNYPSGYRVLCYNCNCARGAYGYCPHDVKVTEETP